MLWGKFTFSKDLQVHRWYVAQGFRLLKK